MVESPGSVLRGARVPARQLHIEHVVAFTTLHRGQGVTERCLQHSAARGALELEGRLIGHRAGFRRERRERAAGESPTSSGTQSLNLMKACLEETDRETLLLTISATLGAAAPRDGT